MLKKLSKVKGVFIMDYNEKVKWLKSYRDKCDRLEFLKIQIECVQVIKYTPGIK